MSNFTHSRRKEEEVTAFHNEPRQGRLVLQVVVIIPNITLQKSKSQETYFKTLEEIPAKELLQAFLTALQGE